MSSENTVNNQQFLSGGGEMGALTRSKDWSKSAVGTIENWPQSLRTTLSIILKSKFPMFLFWGKDLTCFYNDAYRPSLGENGKHPFILGQGGEESWPEIWHIIKPLMDQVLSGGEATWSEDQLIPIYRNGKLEDVYWTFSYSAVNDESGKVAGVMVICSETTEKVNTLKKSEASEREFRQLANTLPALVWTTSTDGKQTFASEKWKEFTGLDPYDETTFQKMVHPDDLENILQTWTHCLATESLYETQVRLRKENGEYQWFYGNGEIVKDEDGKTVKWIGTFVNINEQKKIEEYLTQALHKVEDSEKKFRNTVKQVPMGITILYGPNFIPEMANENYLQIVDKKEEDFIGKPLFDSLPEVKEVVEPLLNGVLTTGIAFHATELPVKLNRYGKEEIGYFNLIYHPLKEEDGTISGIIVVAFEVTDSVIAKHALAESENQFRNMVMRSPIAMTIFRGEDHIIEMANIEMIQNLWRKKETDVLGKKALEAFPELNDQKYSGLLKKVYQTGIAYRENESVAYVVGDDGLKKFYLDYEYSPLFEPNGEVSGIMITVNDVTEKVDARKKVEDAEERMRLATEATELSTWDLDLQNDTIFHSPRLADIFGHAKSKKISHLEMLSQLHPDDVETVVKKAFEEALKTSVYKYEARIIKTSGDIRWIRTQGKVFYDENNKPSKMLGTLRDITEEKLHQQELQESEQKFRLLSNSMPQHIWTANPKGNLNYFNQSVFDYSGLTPKEIKEGGWLQIVHPDDRENNIKEWMNSVATGKNFLFEHRFRRYDGEYRWQLSRAIPQKDTFGNIQMWVGTSTDIQDQKTFTDELERQVQQRTRELEQKNTDLEKMNTELQSFAYVSSHDLQEPLRKIQTFASRLLDKEFVNLSDNAKEYFLRMQEAANRMQTLIQDLLAYSRTNSDEQVFTRTNLREIVNELIIDFHDAIEEKNGILEADEMFEADVIPFQLRQLLHNLIGNALKFARPEIPPHIQIKTKIIKGRLSGIEGLLPNKLYCHMSVSDNGIGFDSQYKDRIFEVFQRLHAKGEFSGTGIGLAIVKKIVENHNGVITASGEQNQGARFDIYFPLSREK